MASCLKTPKHKHAPKKTAEQCCAQACAGACGAMSQTCSGLQACQGGGAAGALGGGAAGALGGGGGLGGLGGLGAGGVPGGGSIPGMDALKSMTQNFKPADFSQAIKSLTAAQAALTSMNPKVMASELGGGVSALAGFALPGSPIAQQLMNAAGVDGKTLLLAKSFMTMSPMEQQLTLVRAGLEMSGIADSNPLARQATDMMGDVGAASSGDPEAIMNLVRAVMKG